MCVCGCVCVRICVEVSTVCKSWVCVSRGCLIKGVTVDCAGKELPSIDQRQVHGFSILGGAKGKRVSLINQSIVHSINQITDRRCTEQRDETASKTWSNHRQTDLQTNTR